MNRLLKINYCFIVLLTTILIILSSCRSTRSIIKEPIKEYGADYLFEELKNNELQFDWFSAKFSLKVHNEKSKLSLNGQIRIKKDSLIWVSFSPALGIEVMRILITNDSIKLLNRIDNTYFISDYDYVNNFLETNIDYDILQSLIIGNDFSYYENGKFKASIDNMEYKLSTAARQKLKKYVKRADESLNIFIQNIWLDPINFKITRVSIKEIKKQNKKIDAEYNDFVLINKQLFPSDVTYKILADNKIDVFLDFSKISLKHNLKFPFKIPSKYNRIE
ncbi:MAG: DUF4292 domain-containing protein [Bacteroidales bacterium]|nr:DUF4292 domain-containing protein [Bacteroidales bacterium]